MERSLIRQPSASPVRIAKSTAALLVTGSAPGRPRQTGQTCVFGGAPKAVLQPQNIFEAVRRCAWISRPMTASYEVTGRSPREWPRRGDDVAGVAAFEASRAGAFTPPHRFFAEDRRGKVAAGFGA